MIHVKIEGEESENVMSKKIVKIILIIVVSILCVSIVFVFAINTYVKLSSKSQIVYDYSNINSVDCILVLGAGITGNKPSPMLEERLLKGIELYEAGVAPKLIMSGDHSREDHDEVNVMKQYAIEKGVPSEDIFMDHAGLSTYESIYRAKEIFQSKKIVIVTQEYHLYRALYIARQLGIDAVGVATEHHSYPGDTAREVREILARNKDFVQCVFKPKPTYLGEVIPVSGNGDITNDK